MNSKPDITNKKDIMVLVDAFYAQVRQDPLLAPVFLQRIPDDASWSPHLQRMYSFWNTILFAANDYHGNPFPRHLGLEIEPRHFERWVGYFHQTIDLYFSGPKANEARDRATKMRAIFESRLAFTEGYPK